MTIRLGLGTLPQLASHAGTPRYDRKDLRAGIVHFGIGNFHRAHMAGYLDELFNMGEGHDWAIVGAGVRPPDVAMRRRLLDQDLLTTLVEQEGDETVVRVTGPMVDFLDPEAPEAIAEAIADPAIRIVSMTVTEGGYYIDPASGHFNPKHPDIVADVADPDHPRTVFGIILKGLRLRRAAGVVPFTVVSCDNMTSNGDVTHATLVGLAHAIDPEFARWVEQVVACPNGMVDRITPATGPRELSRVRDEFGIEDTSPVFCEAFKQWVIEDHFTAGRPALEKVGVTFVEDVIPFELMKIRILNGGHAAIAYPGGLLDYEFVADAMGDPLIAAWLQRLGTAEIIPLVPPVPGMDLHRYLARVTERFSNEPIGDTIARLCLDGSNRQPKYILPSALDALKAGKPFEGLALASAMWCRYAAGVSDSGKEIPPNDPNWDRIQAAAIAAKSDPSAFLAMDDIFGQVTAFPAYVDTFSDWLRMLWRDGTRATLTRYLSSGS